MNSELQTFSALPIRRRETLEIFDTALKLYRRYFWVLLGWSALVAVLAITPILSTFSLFTMPLLYGAVSCCVAAAVRGQSVRFSQCWAFTKPRYGALLGVTLLSWLLFAAVLIVFYIAAALLAFGGIFALQNAPQPVQVVFGILGFLLLLVGFSGMGVVAFGWTSMVPIVACLEDDKRGTAAMGRAFELLKGNWKRVFGMALILGLAMLAVFGIVGGGMAGLVGLGSLREIFGAAPSDSAVFGLMGTFGAITAMFYLLWLPAQLLVVAVLYLDLRVRREALDLEWNAYASAPAPAPRAANAVELEKPIEVAPYAVTSDQSAPQNLPVALFSGAPPETSPASFAAGIAATAESPIIPETALEIAPVAAETPQPFALEATPIETTSAFAPPISPPDEARRD
ncbi:MAG TPA: hypothetical protein VGB45_00110 [Abditibacterium sp.]